MWTPPFHLPHLATSAQPQDEVKGRLLLDVVIRQGPTVFELFAGEDKTLLVWRNALLILNLRLHIVDCVRRFNLERYCLTREGLDKDLHTATETEHEMEGRLLLDIVV